jgi:hypothetical protein
LVHEVTDTISKVDPSYFLSNAADQTRRKTAEEMYPNPVPVSHAPVRKRALPKKHTREGPGR